MVPLQRDGPVSSSLESLRRSYAEARGGARLAVEQQYGAAAGTLAGMRIDGRTTA